MTESWEDSFSIRYIVSVLSARWNATISSASAVALTHSMSLLTCDQVGCALPVDWLTRYGPDIFLSGVWHPRRVSGPRTQDPGHPENRLTQFATHVKVNNRTHFLVSDE